MENTKIQREEVVFNTYGQWSHSAIHEIGEEFDDVPFNEIPAFQGLEILPIRVFDDEKIELLCGTDANEGPADFRKWQPDAPEDDSWFPFSFSDDEYGPYVMYARPKSA